MNNLNFIKNIIPIEIELGFVRIPSKNKSLFPKKNDQVVFYLNGKNKTKLSYNFKHQRVFGLVGFFKKEKAEPRDVLRFERIKDREFNLFLEKKADKEAIDIPLSEDEAEEIIDIGEVSSQGKGNIVESRIKELIILYSQGILNVYEPAADIEGIDLVVLKRKIFQPLFIQVKSKFKLRGNNFQIGIKASAISPHHTFFVVGAYYNPQKMDIDDYIVFIPSEVFIKRANIINKGKKNETYVLNTLLRRDANNKFSEFVIRKDNLVTKIFKKFQEIERYYK